MNDIDLDQFRHWTPSAQAKLLETVKRNEQATNWRPWYCPDERCDGNPHDDWEWRHCRADQRPPKGAWFAWVLRGGRGSGKTRTGAEWTRRMVSLAPRFALVARTGADIRDTLVEGESGILATSPPNARPEWEPSKRRLTWPNGSVATCFSAEEPDRLRGPQHFAAWCDEMAHWPLAQEVWDNLLLGLRLGRHPRVCITTTPRPTKLIREILKDPTTRDVRVSTYANLSNLAPSFRDTVLKRYEGTRMGAQELHGEILEDVEGALWAVEMIETHRVQQCPEDFDRIVISVDPAGTANRKSDETGIVALGRIGTHVYVLEDLSGRYSPHGWATRAVRAYEKWNADMIVAERNYGGQMVEATIRGTGTQARVKTVHSRRGKAIRAEPIVGQYEQGRWHHVGMLDELETEQTTWVPGEGDSPNRVDALVHGGIELTNVTGVAQILSAARRMGR